MSLSRPARAPLPNPVAGQYLFPTSEAGASTSVTHGNGTLRLMPWLVETLLKIDRLGAEVTVVGEAGSKVRLGIYSDTGSAYPGALLLDAGQILGDSATVQDITISTLTLAPGLYWIGGAVQSAPTTQPTVRITSGWTPPVNVGVGTSLPTAGTVTVGFAQTGVTAALPGTFTASVTLIGSGLRVHARLA